MKQFNFFKINDLLINENMISCIDCKELNYYKIIIHLTSGEIITVNGQQTIDIVMQAKPSIIEGKRFKFKKFIWIIHNLIGHPLMQIFAMVRCYKLAIWIHEITIPRPLGKNNDTSNNKIKI